MMYGDNKKREMARSILPSKRRGHVKDNLCAIRRKARRAARRDTRLISHEEDFGAFTERDLYAYPTVDIRREVQERRDADKLAHFQTWAIKVTDGMEPDARMAHMMKILPDNLIGWHARSHLRWLDEFELDLVRQERVLKYLPNRSHPFQHRFAPVAPVAIRNVLPLILESEAAREALQVYMQKKHVTCKWILKYGKADVHREERYVPGGKGYSKNYRYPGRWDVIVTFTPVVLSERALGASQPPFVPRSAAGLGEFLDALSEADTEPLRVSSEPHWLQRKQSVRLYAEKGCGPETCVTFVKNAEQVSVKARSNPDSHPEWLKAVQDFCTAFMDLDGDLYRVERKLAKPSVEKTFSW